MKVLIADDTKSNQMLFRTYIESEGYEVVTASNGLEAVSAFKKEIPDLILLDVVMPEMDGYEAATRIKKLCKKRNLWIPIIFLSAKISDEDVVKGIEAGGDDYLTKPVSQTVLNAKLKAMQRIAAMREELERVNQKLKDLAEVDGLTGISNRRHFDYTLSKECRLTRRSKEPISLIMADIDFFKPFNDIYGHQGGDDCLKLVAKALLPLISRAGDLVARYGGEEFVVILPNTGAEGALVVAEKMRKAIESLEIDHEGSSVSSFVTMSLGIAAAIDVENIQPAGLIEAADKNLYKAKEAGRNTVVS
jgi:diguanylate cyclase (GGDEF)-like protein